MKKLLLLFAFSHLLIFGVRGAIDRHAVVSRNNPLIYSVDTLASLSVGNGTIAATVDVTGMQSFPEFYRRGIPLTTMSDWGWHSFPNPDSLCHDETLRNMDFGHGHGEVYAVEYKDNSRNAAATQYYRINPHRLNLGIVGLEMYDESGVLITPADISAISQQLDLWNGRIESSFTAGGHDYAVTTACMPHHDCLIYNLSGQAMSIGNCNIVLRLPYPTGLHSDDAADWSRPDLHSSGLIELGNGHATIKHSIDSTDYYIHLSWLGGASVDAGGAHRFVLAPETGNLLLAVEFSPYATPSVQLPPDITSTSDSLFQQVAEYRQNFWNSGGIVDFGLCTDPRARELERRVVLSQYLTTINCSGSMPPQETGLTYNSWFGRPHLEMAWWHMVDHCLWGHGNILERQLQWYIDTALPQACNIASRQGYHGARWMKMTDPQAGEAPSNTGSFLLWQQPHFIYLAEELYRSNPHDSVLRKYAGAVEATAEFMASWTDAALDSAGYLFGHTSMQESMRKDFSYGHPFEQAYWIYGLTKAQQWRERLNQPRRSDWDSLLQRISPPARDSSGLYVAGLPCSNFDPDATTREFNLYISERLNSSDQISEADFYLKSHSDHPAVLAVAAMLPDMGLFDADAMRLTLEHVLSTWHWSTTWGWDYGMTALAAARLGRPGIAVDILLAPYQKNICLPNGHNYQDSRLRAYLPGNGALLTAIAAMCAGWEGAPARPCPGFPDSWPVRWEGLTPMQ